MLRVAVILGLCLMAAPAMADQSQASFSVGVTVVKKGKPSRSADIRKLTYTWGAARVSIAKAGYRDIRRNTRSDGLYWFTARKGHSLYRVAVSATTGTIEKVIPA